MSRRHCLPIIIFGVVLLGALSNPVPGWSFLYEVQVLDSASVAKLTEDQLINNYIDAMIELDASTIFHKAAGFNPKEFDKYKKLLRYAVDLNLEIQKRKIQLPDLKMLNNRE